jgi:hypothetical protein
MKTAIKHTFQGVANEREMAISFITIVAAVTVAYAFAHFSFGFTLHFPKY